MIQPVRIQRKRVKGWKMPPNTVSVTRPGQWGNPYKLGHNGNGIFISTVDAAIELFKIYAEKRMEVEPDWLNELKGKNLACFCNLEDKCHADLLLDLANK